MEDCMSFRKLTAACLCSRGSYYDLLRKRSRAPIALNPATSTIAKLASMGQMKFGEFPVDQDNKTKIDPNLLSFLIS